MPRRTRSGVPDARGPLRHAPASEREPIRQAQRERLLAAMVDEVAHRGYAGTTLAAVSTRAGLPQASFHANFAGMEECLLAAIDVLVHRALAHASMAYHRTSGQWPQRVQAALRAYLSFLAARPSAARVCLVEALEATPRALEHRSKGLALMQLTFAEMLVDAPREGPSPVAQHAAQDVWDAIQEVWDAIERQVREARAGELTARTRELSDRIVAAADQSRGSR